MKRIVLSVLALLAFTACVSAGAPAGDPTWPEAQSVLNQGIKADGIKKIEINLKNEALNISLSENENITIEILSNHQMGNPQVSVDPKAIKIEQKEKEEWAKQNAEKELAEVPCTACCDCGC